ncbi:MAG: hypothetical protein HRT69_12305 [Flavobacteriaceae bacterium]|nr:hypothetical protein [Flavobacteriaceae bacterium]
MSITNPIIQKIEKNIPNPKPGNESKPIAPTVTFVRQMGSVAQFELRAFIDAKATQPNVQWAGTNNNYKVYIDYSFPSENPEKVNEYKIAFDYKGNIANQTVTIYVRDTNPANSIEAEIGSGTTGPETSRGTETVVQPPILDEVNK